MKLTKPQLKKIAKAETIIKQAQFVQSNISGNMENWEEAHDLFWSLLSQLTKVKYQIIDFSHDDFLRINDIHTKLRDDIDALIS